MDQLASDQTLPRTTSPNKGFAALRAAVFFFLFPPIGIFFLWKNKELHELFAILTALLGFFNFLVVLILYSSYDKLVDFSDQVGYSIPTNLDKLFLILLFFLIYQILSCLVLVREAKKTGYLTKIRLLYLLGLIFIDYVVILWLVGKVAIELLKTYLAKYQNQLDQTSWESY